MRLGLRFVFLACLAAVLACTSPTLPLPPPEAPSESAGTTPGTVVLVGAGATPGALIVVENQPKQVAAADVVKSDGTWTVTIAAVKLDVLHITELIGDQESQTLDFTVLIN